MEHDLDPLDILTDTDPREVAVWWRGVAAAAATFVITCGWWAPRTWWVALTSHPGHGLAVARVSPRRRA